MSSKFSTHYIKRYNAAKARAEKLDLLWSDGGAPRGERVVISLYNGRGNLEFEGHLKAVERYLDRTFPLPPAIQEPTLLFRLQEESSEILPDFVRYIADLERRIEELERQQTMRESDGK